jgi:ADP-heptose:LPS heptosyltransferase
MTGRTLAVRLDGDGDVLLAGPAIRALARAFGPVDLLASPAGASAGRLLPRVDDVLVYDAPWSGYAPPPLDPSALTGLVRTLAARGYDRAVVFTSFHQSPLPAALVARMAGIPCVAADCEDYPGSLLDVRHRRRSDVHEVTAALDLVAAAGAHPAPGDGGTLAVVPDLPEPPIDLPRDGFVVVHPGASVPSRAMFPDHARGIVAALHDAGRDVVVTGGAGELDLAGAACTGSSVNAAGRTNLAQLGALLRRAGCVVVGNTGPAHLAAAVGTPVVSLFSPVVPAQRWAPFGVPAVVLGDQSAPCARTRARECPAPGHPCLSGVDPADVVLAVEKLAGAAA